MSRRVLIPRDAVGVRVDRFLQSRVDCLPHSLYCRWIRDGAVRVANRRVKSVGHRIRADDNEIFIPDVNGISLNQRLPCPRRMESVQYSSLTDLIVYEDEFMIAVNKPYGLAVQGGTGISVSLDRLVWKLAEPSPVLVHRLDQDCSGLLLLAKTPLMATALTSCFQNRDISKSYIAVVDGLDCHHNDSAWHSSCSMAVRARTIGGFERFVPMAALDRTGHLVINGESPKQCRTQWRRLSSNGLVSLLEMSPITGRKHQLRSHCAYQLNAPIIGDNKYNGRKFSRLLLHSLTTKFIHPIFQTDINLMAPLTPCIIKSCNQLKLPIHLPPI